MADDSDDLQHVFRLIERYGLGDVEQELTGLHGVACDGRERPDDGPKPSANTKRRTKTVSKKERAGRRTTKNAPSAHSDISYIPLHNRQPSSSNISAARLEELRKEFVIDRGPWTSKEVNILRANWDRFTKCHPELSDPKFAFGNGHDQGGKLSFAGIKKLRREYKKYQILRRMALGLNDRLMCDVYMKCRQIFHDKSFRYSSRLQVPREVEKAIRHDLKSGMRQIEISYLYDVAPCVVKMIKQNPKRMNTVAGGRYIWSDDALQHLKMVVEFMHAPKDIHSLDLCDIKWKRVSKELRSLGFRVKRKHCRYKWAEEFPMSRTQKGHIRSILASQPETKSDQDEGRG